jgi:hypothetical protein
MNPIQFISNLLENLKVYFTYLRDLETESLSFAVVVLIASIPLAIEIVTTTTLALGSKVLTVRVTHTCAHI